MEILNERTNEQAKGKEASTTMTRDGQQHQLQQTPEGWYTCERCCLTWKQPPGGKCPGVKVYQYTAIPWNELATSTMLKRQKLKLANVAQPDGCYFRLKGKEYIALYKIEEAQPRRTPTEAQREAIQKMRDGLKRKYTCERCGFYDDSHGQLRGKHYRHLRISTIKVGGEEKRYCGECREYLIWVHDRHVIEHNMAVWLAEDSEAPPFLVLDTETVGLPDHPDFQVVEIAAVDRAGTVVFHSLVKPDVPMPSAASQVNGLTDDDLADAPPFAEIWPQLAELLGNYALWCYNAAFDQAALLRSAKRFGLEIPERLKSAERWNCVMEEFARYYGEYSTYWGRDKYKDLYTACRVLGVQGSDYHRATGDALNTLGVMQALAALGGTFPEPEERPVGNSYYEGDYSHDY
jgi:DNA polymerase-3 subunit epsilon